MISQENQPVNPNQISNEEKDDKSANLSPDISDAMSVSTSDSSSSSDTSLDEYNHKKRQKFMSERTSPVDTRTVSMCPDNKHPVSNDEGVTQVPTSHDLNVSSPNISHSLNFNLSNLDRDSSNWVDIGLNLQTPITARDLVTLENQSRGQSDVISLFGIHTDRNLIAHAFNIQRKCLATLAIENTLKEECHYSVAGYLPKCVSIKSDHFDKLLVLEVFNLEMHLNGYSRYFHLLSQEVKRRFRVIFLFKNNSDDTDPQLLVNGYIAAQIDVSNSDKNVEAYQAYSKIFGRRDLSFLAIIKRIKGIRAPYKYPRVEL